MEKDSGSWFHHQHLHPLSPNLNLLGFPFDIGWLNAKPVHRNPNSVEDPTLRRLHTKPVHRNPNSVEDPTLRSSALSPLSGMQEWKASEPNGFHSPYSFYSGPHFHQAFAPVWNSTPKDKFPGGTVDVGQKRSPIITTAPAQKRFLVFDQSGDKTTLIYSSGVDTPVQFGTYCVPKPPTTYNLINEEPRISLYPLRPIMNDGHVENNSQDSMENEMHEDTEELNALLFSDSDSDFSEDEEISTGHSPSTMTDNGIPDLVKEMGEEVDSFAGPNKRQKLLDGCYDVPSSQRRTRSPLRTYACSALEDEAESTCGNGNRQSIDEVDLLSGGKRKERIWETVSILKRIFPNVNGKNAIVVIDEAIHYLRSLRVKAKALGLDTL